MTNSSPDQKKLTLKQSHVYQGAYNFLSIKGSLHDACPNVVDRRFENNIFIIAGYAGTGKSVVLSKVWRDLTDSGLVGTVMTLTSRAAESLCEKGVPCSTYHSVLYEAILDHLGNLLYHRLRSDQEIKERIGSYAVFDEAGFTPTEVVKKLTDLGIPVLLVGDDAQLPTIEGQSIFDIMFDLEKIPPIHILEEVLRTDDGSTIPFFADHIRRTGKFDWSLAGPDIANIKKNKLNVKWFKENWASGDWDMVICGMNNTRQKMNRLVRASQGFFNELPEKGERVLCLNNGVVAGAKISNGDIYEVVAVFPGKEVSDFVIRKISTDRSKGPSMTISVDNNFWTDETSLQKNKGRKDLHEFTFGYALTCHKMQGSEAKNIIVYDEDVSFFLDQGRYRYSACTRAKSNLLVAL